MSFCHTEFPCVSVITAHDPNVASQRCMCDAETQVVAAAGTGGDPWKPRLQRLADARKLAPFERLVLELLVGCHVSPSVQRTFLNNKPGSGMDEMTAMSPITVSYQSALDCLRVYLRAGFQHTGCKWLQTQNCSVPRCSTCSVRHALQCVLLHEQAYNYSRETGRQA